MRSADDIASDGAFAYRRRKSNGKYRYTIFYKGKFALTSDETSTLEGSSVSYTHPEWTGLSLMFQGWVICIPWMKTMKVLT